MKKIKYWIGIDPGKAGGIAVIDSLDKVAVFAMPTAGKEIDLIALSSILEQYIGADAHCVLEDVHSIFGAGAKSNFQLKFCTDAHKN